MKAVFTTVISVDNNKATFGEPVIFFRITEKIGPRITDRPAAIPSRGIAAATSSPLYKSLTAARTVVKMTVSNALDKSEFKVKKKIDELFNVADKRKRKLLLKATSKIGFRPIESPSRPKTGLIKNSMKDPKPPNLDRNIPTSFDE